MTKLLPYFDLVSCEPAIAWVHHKLCYIAFAKDANNNSAKYNHMWQKELSEPLLTKNWCNC